MKEIPRTGRIYLKGVAGSFPSFLLSRANRKSLIFYRDEEEAFLLAEEIEFFSKRKVHIYPAKKNRVFEESEDFARLGFLFSFLSEDEFIGAYPQDEIEEPVLSREALISGILSIKVGETLFQEKLVGYLLENGYTQVSTVRQKGEFSKRGSVVDVYSPNYEEPIRLEFMGDQIFSVRIFDPETQRSKAKLHSVNFISLRKADGNETIADYIEDGMLILASGIEKSVRDLEVREKLLQRLNGCLILDSSGISDESDENTLHAQSNDDLRAIFQSRRNEIFKIIVEKMRDEWRECPLFYLVASNRAQALRLKEILESYGVSLKFTDYFEFPEKREWAITYGTLRRGFRCEQMIVLTEDEIFGPKRRVLKTTTAHRDEILEDFRSLSPGDYVVHIDYGIGIFRGTREIKVEGCTRDFLEIEYEGGDKLYVPSYDLNKVQKYISTEGKRPKIDKLGSRSWLRTKSRVKRKIEDVAKELLQIYAERQLLQGFQFSEEDELFREMESRFEYEETEGQRRAIEEVLSDMKSPRPMDRLLCGDSGFGKTEVAIRAAFKAVLDGKQVAFLVPTTVLAEQHFRTLSERLGDYGVNIEVLSRFRPKEKQKEIIRKLSKGEIDIIIGTHRILQDDVSFFDLGLLIVDEEQRFGVKDKEKLKMLKKNIDVLTLTATPIPRTLYMALTGIKDLSVIDTPPLDRLAVKTFVTKFGDDVIRKGILRELERGGQVYFVHNFIYNIETIRDYLLKLIPGLKVAVAHGRMRESDLERVMLDFIDRKYDVLLSTNIVESGLDISNANTIFINNAHRMGLAELYQLRGRVGRGPRQAYAYLLVPENEILTRDALLRLKIIEDMTQVGSGFYIANYDLEIRGCGNLLGKEQSGNVDAVGFELYLSMLENAIREIKDKVEVEEETYYPEISIPIEAYIPKSYVEDPSQKLILYRRLARIKEEEKLKEMREEIRDRFGEIPKPVENLFRVLDLRILLLKAKVKKVEKVEKGILIHVTDKTPIEPRRLVDMAKKDGVKLLAGKGILCKLEKDQDPLSLTKNVLLNVLAM